MVLAIPILLMYSIQPTLSLRAYNCCSGPPDIWALGPPPKPPWLKNKFECNSTGFKVFENSSLNPKESTAALQDKVLGDLTVAQLVILIICLLLLIVVLIVLVMYVKRKYKKSKRSDGEAGLGSGRGDKLLIQLPSVGSGLEGAAETDKLAGAQEDHWT